MWRTRMLVVLLVILTGSRAYAQGPMQPAAGQVVGPPYSPRPVVSSCAAGTPGCGANEDNNGSLLFADPLLAGKQIEENVFAPGPYTAGLFFGVEANIVDPHIRQQMFTFVGPFQTGSGFHLQDNELHVTVSPVFQIGYRLGEGLGEFLFNYQFLDSSGSGAGVDGFGNPSTISSHLSVNVFDILYAHRENSLGPWCDMKWFMGVRIANAFFDTDSNNAFGQQSLSNNFVGAGPMVGLNLSKAIKGTGLDLFCRSECAFLYGPVSQEFNAGGGAIVDQQHVNWVFVPKVEIGIGWSPVGNERFHFALGYTIQYWSNLAENSPTGSGTLPDSRGDLTVQGGFLRLEWNY